MLDLFLNKTFPESNSSSWVNLFFVLFVVFIGPAPCFGRQDEFRTWKDSSGKFSIEAKFVSEEDGSVKLEKRDGTQITIPRGKLSRTDQDFLKGAAEKDVAPTTVKPGLVEVSTSDVRILEIDKTMGWNLSQQPVAEKVTSTNESIEFTWWDDSTDEALEKMSFVRTAVVRNPRSPNWLMYVPGGVGGPIRSGFYNGIAFDMLDNKPVGKFTGAPLSPMNNALDDQAIQMLCVDQDMFSRDYSVNLFQLDGKKIRQRAVLYLGKDKFIEYSRDHPLVQFAGADHYLVSASQFGKVLTGCCNATRGSLDWMIEHDKGRYPFVTPDGNTMIIHIDNGLVAIDIESGTQSGWTAAPESSRGTLSLSPDGTKLVEADHCVISVRDFQTGTESTRFAVYVDRARPPHEDSPIEVFWINNRRLALISRSLLKDSVSVVDFDLQTTLCNYLLQPQSQCSVDMSGRLRYLAPDPPKLVWQSVSLPHAEIEQEIEANLVDLVKLDHSIPVSISAEWVAGLITYFVLEREEGQENQPLYRYQENVDLGSEVKAILTEKFSQAGFQVADNGQAILTTRTSKTKPGEDPVAPLQPPVDGEIVFGQGAKGGSGAGRILDKGSSRPTIEKPKYTPVSRLPDEAVITGTGYSLRSNFAPLEFDGTALWTPELNGKVARKVRNDLSKFGYEHVPAREIVLQMLQDIDVPQVIVRPRNVPLFEIKDDGIKRVRNSSDKKED